MDDAQCRRYRRLELWTAAETADLLAGIAPGQDPGGEEQVGERGDAIRALADASQNALPYVVGEGWDWLNDDPGDRKYKPEDVIRWAGSRWERFPFSELPAPQPQGIPRDNTLLVIIDALLKYDEIDPAATDAVRTVQQLVEYLGETMDAKTVRKVLDRIKELRTERSRR